MRPEWPQSEDILDLTSEEVNRSLRSMLPESGNYPYAADSMGRASNGEILGYSQLNNADLAVFLNSLQHADINNNNIAATAEEEVVRGPAVADMATESRQDGQADQIGDNREDASILVSPEESAVGPSNPDSSHSATAVDSSTSFWAAAAVAASGHVASEEMSAPPLSECFGYDKNGSVSSLFNLANDGGSGRQRQPVDDGPTGCDASILAESLPTPYNDFSNALEAFNNHASIDRAPIGFSATMATFQEAAAGLDPEERSLAAAMGFSFSFN